LVASGAGRAEAMLKPVPVPDFSHLPEAKAKALRDAQEQFDQYRQTMVGDKLIETYALIAGIYTRNGFYDSAAVALENAALLAPNDGRWVYGQGIVARLQKQSAVAQNYFEQAFKLDPDYLPIRVTLARMRMESGDLDGARKLLDDYTAQHNDAAAPYALLGEIALRQKRYADAIEQTRHALALDANATRLYTQLAQAQAAAGDAKGAAESRAQAGNGEPAMADPLAEGLLPGTHPAASAGNAAAPVDAHTRDMAAAAQAFAARQYDDARKRLDDLLKQNAKDADALALYARVEAAGGHFTEAQSRAAAAIAAAPHDGAPYLAQGIALEMANDDSGAQRAYEQAVHNDAKLAEARLRLGALLMRTAHNDAAIEQFRALVQLNPLNREAWMRLIAADTIAGKCTAALRDVSDVLGRDANNRFLLEMFVRLASTCSGASAEQKRGALEYGDKLYKANATAAVSEAFALALAAAGRWDDAVKTQEGALFVLVRDGMPLLTPAYRENLQKFQAHKLPDLPWSASASVFHPTRLMPDALPTAK
jgi:tetratricopeptide (TPR) repeat protein